MTDDFEGWLTVPEAARALEVSDQTVRRWVRRKLVPSSVNAQNWPQIRLGDVPADLLAATKKLSGKRYPKPDVTPELPDARSAEIDYLRSVNDKLLEIIKLLSGRPGDHPVSGPV